MNFWCLISEGITWGGKTNRFWVWMSEEGVNTGEVVLSFWLHLPLMPNKYRQRFKLLWCWICWWDRVCCWDLSSVLLLCFCRCVYVAHTVNVSLYQMYYKFWNLNVQQWSTEQCSLIAFNLLQCSCNYSVFYSKLRCNFFSNSCCMALRNKTVVYKPKIDCMVSTLHC